MNEARSALSDALTAAVCLIAGSFLTHAGAFLTAGALVVAVWCGVAHALGRRGDEDEVDVL